MTQGASIGRHYATGLPVRVRHCGGVIVAVEEAPGVEPEAWIAPALVDLQVNGSAGVDFQQDDVPPESLLAATRSLQAAGCSRFLLTLVTDDWPRLTARLRHLGRLRRQSPELQRAIAGWHLEGPFLSAKPGFHGAHDPGRMLDPTADHIRELRAITGSDPLLLTVAPERRGALEAIALAVSLGIRISLGHTDASADTLAQAVRAGATGFTHLGNACPQQLDRHDNIVWRVLDTPGLEVSMIPDQIHVAPALFRLIHRALGQDRTFYVTDAMSAADAPPRLYRLGPLEVEVGLDQVVRQPGRTNLAGSALRPIDGIVRTAEMLGCDWQAVWDGFSARPAKFMGWSAGLGVGAPADWCLLTEPPHGARRGEPGGPGSPAGWGGSLRLFSAGEQVF
jgi:N-acetylglucosamine-6-phosphate deacetylase